MKHPPANRPHPAWFTPRLPAPEECSFGALLERGALAQGDSVCLLFEDGSSWSWAEARRQAARSAAALAALGVARGDCVLNWLPNGPAQLRLWLGLAWLGAVNVPLNTSYRGAILSHVVATSGAKLMVAHAELVPRLAEAGCAAPETLVVLGGAPEAGQLGKEALEAPADAAPPAVLCGAWDLATITYTSGTTGASKAVRVPYGQLWTYAYACYGYMRADDRMLVMTPLCHFGPIAGVAAVLVHGASLALYNGFSTSEFWNVVRHTGATTLPGLVHAIQDFLAKTPPRADDRDNTLRLVPVRTASAATRAFGERFGVSCYAGFAMSETGMVLATEVDPPAGDSCGRPVDGLEVRLVDANDCEVAEGEVGEIIVRPALPWIMNDGYHNAPEASYRAWRNGWFHTGDLAWRDPAGDYHFADRLKDAIKRRGENVSSNEIELVAATFPGVQYAGAVGVASAHGDQEILLVIQPLEGSTIDPAELIRYLIPRMAHFMVPRYVRVIAELPRTYTGKVSKTELRSAGLTPDCWDREAAGIEVKRDRLTSL